MTRRESREAAFLLLFEWSFREEETIDEVVELARLCREAEIDSFARLLAGKTLEYRIQIDHEIESRSDRWKLSRLGRVTLSVLRMGVCELGWMDDIPAGATINEAVELMKKYATEDEAAYVNGILGAFHRGMQNPEATAESPQEQPQEVSASEAE